MEKLDAKAMKERTEAAIDHRNNSITMLMSGISRAARHGTYSYITEKLTESQQRQLTTLGYKLTKNQFTWVISWDHIK